MKHRARPNKSAISMNSKKARHNFALWNFCFLQTKECRWFICVGTGSETGSRLQVMNSADVNDEITKDMSRSRLITPAPSHRMSKSDLLEPLASSANTELVWSYLLLHSIWSLVVSWVFVANLQSIFTHSFSMTPLHHLVSLSWSHWKTTRWESVRSWGNIRSWSRRQPICLFIFKDFCLIAWILLHLLYHVEFTRFHFQTLNMYSKDSRNIYFQLLPRNIPVFAPDKGFAYWKLNFSIMTLWYGIEFSLGDCPRDVVVPDPLSLYI
jgi:hypothetical protein